MLQILPFSKLESVDVWQFTVHSHNLSYSTVVMDTQSEFCLKKYHCLPWMGQSYKSDPSQ